MEGVLTDGKTGRIQDDYMIPYYRNNDFSEGLRSGVEAIIGVLNGNLIVQDNKSGFREVIGPVVSALFCVSPMLVILIIALIRAIIQTFFSKSKKM